MDGSTKVLALTLPTLAVGPAAAALLWSHGPLLALAAAPLAASTVVLGLAGLLAPSDIEKPMCLSERVQGHFGPEWHAAAGS